MDVPCWSSSVSVVAVVAEEVLEQEAEEAEVR